MRKKCSDIVAKLNLAFCKRSKVLITNDKEGMI